MLQSACAKKCKEMREKTNREQLQQFTGRSYRKKGKYSFPYTNSVKSELNTYMNCCVKLIYLMLKILELLKNERLSVH